MKILIASDHAGFELKQYLVKSLQNLKLNIQDLGPFSTDSVDYPDFADLVSSQINHSHKDSAEDSLSGSQVGVLICGSGQGMAIRANKYPFVRAALCESEEMAKLSREHNNANILCLGARFIPPDKALAIFDAFLKTTFAGGRHATRVKKIQSPLKG